MAAAEAETGGAQAQAGASRETKLWQRLAWWALYAAAFGYVEAMVVVYLRKATGMAPGLDYRAIFAARNLDFDSAHILAEMQRHGVLGLELGREAATIVLLLGAAMAGGRNGREKWGLFGYTFAVWDLTYYAWLVLFIGFPRSLFDIDLYYLIPWAWYGPVWFPVLVFMPTLLALSLRLLLTVQREPTA